MPESWKKLQIFRSDMLSGPEDLHSDHITGSTMLSFILISESWVALDESTPLRWRKKLGKMVVDSNLISNHTNHQPKLEKTQFDRLLCLSWNWSIGLPNMHSLKARIEIFNVSRVYWWTWIIQTGNETSDFTTSLT